MNAGPSRELQQGEDNQLIVRSLGCVRGDKLLFRDLNFTLKPGQSGLVTGPNGVGKSSLLRLIAGLLSPVSGTIRKPSSMALCDDRLALDENLPLGQALQFWTRLDGKTSDDGRAAMHATGLDHLAEVPIRYFSTGQRQRARIARTLQSGANLWLLDEPANGLDSRSVELLGAALQSHVEKGGMILAASHIPLPIDFNLSLQLDTPEAES